MVAKLGDMVEDSITGFRGRLTAVTSFLTGCDRATVTALSKNGDAPITDYFDVPRLVVAKDAPKLDLTAFRAPKPGGGPNPPRRTLQP